LPFSWGAGCIDRVDSGCHGVFSYSSTNASDGTEPIFIELGDESGRPVTNAAVAVADKNLVSALPCFRVKSNLTIEVNVGVSVEESILANPDNHLLGCGGGVLLGKANEIAAPVVVV